MKNRVQLYNPCISANNYKIGEKYYFIFDMRRDDKDNKGTVPKWDGKFTEEHEAFKASEMMFTEDGENKAMFTEYTSQQLSNVGFTEEASQAEMNVQFTEDIGNNARNSFTEDDDKQNLIIPRTSNLKFPYLAHFLGKIIAVNPEEKYVETVLFTAKGEIIRKFIADQNFKHANYFKFVTKALIESEEEKLILKK